MTERAAPRRRRSESAAAIRPAAVALAALAALTGCERRPMAEVPPRPAADIPPRPAADAPPSAAADAAPHPTTDAPARSAPAADALLPEAEFLAAVDSTRGTKDCFVPLRDPPFDAAAASGLADETRVLGLDLGDAQCAYPVPLMNLHEIVEHRLAGLELLACW